MTTRNTKHGLKLWLLACLALPLLMSGSVQVRAAGNDGTPVGSPPYVTAAPNFGQAVSLDGSTQYISLPDPGPFTLTANQPYTMEARVKTTDSNGTKVMLGQINSAYNAGWYLGLVNGTPSFAALGNPAPPGITASASIADGNWHTIAAVVQAGSPATETLYVDGVQAATASFTETASQAGSAAIGQFGNAGSFFSGQIDEVRVSNVARYTAASYTPAAAPFISDARTVALYHLDGNAQDSSVVANTISIADSHPYFSPDNWYSDGAGAMQSSNIHAGSTVAISNNPGAYLKVSFTGTSCALNLDLSALAGTNAAYYPTVRWSVDGGPYSPVHLLTSSDGTLLVASGLSAGSHTERFEYVGGGGGTATDPDRYLNPAAAVRINGITLDSGASLLQVTPLPRVVITTADSLGEGVRVNGAAGLFDDQNAFATVGWQIAQALGMEWGNRSIGGGGWTRGGSGNTPPFFAPGNDTNSWWNKYSAGKPLLISGLLPQQPYLWFVFYGTNDGLQNATDADVATSVTGWLTAARAAAPAANIVLGVPPGQYKRSAILAGFTAYQGAVTSRPLTAGGATYAGTADAKAFLVDLGPSFAIGLAQFGTPSAVSFDGLHPSAATDGYLATAYTQAIQQAIQQAITPATATKLPVRRLQ